MSAGLPIIGSNFPLWSKVIGDNKCGLVVDPLKSQAIADSIDWILDNPNEAKLFGENGKKIVETKFKWNIEENK